MKKIVFNFLLLVSFSSYSQNDYIVAGSDTIHCYNINYKLTSQSYLSSIIFADEEMVNRKIDDKKYMRTISTFFKNGVFIDKIPQKADKPESYIKWAERVVDGKLKVNYYHSEMTTYGDPNFHHGGAVTSGITKFFIKMPDGTFYDIRKNSDMKNHIIPYLKNCEAFNNAYTGKFDDDYKLFTEMITLYNSVCK